MIPREVREFGGIRIDTTRWPLVFWDWPAQRTDDARVLDAFEHVGSLWTATPRGVKSFTVVDLSGVRQAASTSQRRAGAGFSTRYARQMADASLGGALVITSPLIRGTVTAVNWLRPPPFPVKVFATRREAVLHGLATIEAAMGSLAPELGALRSTYEREAASR